jgi:hypothetical protein
MTSEQYNLLKSLFEKEKDKIKIDDELKKRIIGLTADTNTQWRKSKTQKQSKSIIETVLDSQEPVKLHIFEDSDEFKGIEEDKKELVKQELQFIANRYAKIYYPEYETEQQPKQQLKSMKELLAIDTGLQINKYHGGKYHEDYSDYEVLLAFFINNIELEHYCIPFYDKQLPEEYNFIKEFYEYGYKASTDILKSVYGEEKFNEIITALNKKYSEMRKTSNSDGNINILLLLQEPYLTKFAEIIEMIEAKFPQEPEKQTPKSIIKELFIKVDCSPFIYARRIAYKDLTTKDKYKEQIAELRKTDDLLGYYRLYKSLYNEVLSHSGIAKRIIEHTINDKLSDEHISFELEFLLDKMIDKTVTKIDRFNLYIDKQIQLGILGKSDSATMFNAELRSIFGWLTLSFNYLYGVDNLFKDNKSIYVSSCGLYTDINFTSDIFYLAFQYVYNDDVVLPVQLSYIKKDSKGQDELDLTKITAENPSYNFDTKYKEHAKDDIMYNNTFAVLTIKYGINSKGRNTTNQGLLYIFITLPQKYVYTETFILYRSRTQYKLMNLFGEKVYADHIIPAKPLTHIEIYTMETKFEYCYSIKLSDDVAKIICKYKKPEDHITLGDYYDKYTLFFSDIPLNEIINQFAIANVKYIKSIIEYSFKSVQIQGKFSHFNIKRINEKPIPQQGGALLNSKKIVNISFDDNKYNDSTIMKINSKNLPKIVQKCVKLETDYIYNPIYNFNNNIDYSVKIRVHTARNYLSVIKHIKNINNNLHIDKINIDNIVINDLSRKADISFDNKTVTEVSINKLFLYNIKDKLKTHTYLRYYIPIERVDNPQRKFNTNIISIYNIYDLIDADIPKQDILIFNSDIKAKKLNAFAYVYIILYNIIILIINCLKKGGVYISRLRSYHTKIFYDFIYILEQLFESVKIINLDLYIDISFAGTYLVCKGYKGDKQIEAELLQNYKKLKEIYPNGLENIAFSDNKLNEEYGIPYDENSNTKIISGFLDKSVKLPKEFLMKLSRATDDKYIHVYKNTKEIVKLIKRYERGEEIRFYPFKEIYLSYTIKYMIINNIEYDIKYFLELLENQKEIVLKKPKATTTTDNKVKSITNAKSTMTNTKKRVSSGSKSKVKTLKRKSLKSK